jgi:hypothetical protein
MHETSGMGLIESSCVICGWVIYHDTLPWQRLAARPRGPYTAEKEIADDPERKPTRRKGGHPEPPEAP